MGKVMRYFIDTNIFLTILNKEPEWKKVVTLLQNIHDGKYKGFTSVICISEILSGFYAENEYEKGDRFVNDLTSINNFKITGIDLAVAREAASIRAKSKIKLPDAMVAASCKVHKCELVSHDTDFLKVKGITVKAIDDVQ